MLLLCYCSGDCYCAGDWMKLFGNVVIGNTKALPQGKRHKLSLILTGFTIPRWYNYAEPIKMKTNCAIDILTLNYWLVLISNHNHPGTQSRMRWIAMTRPVPPPLVSYMPKYISQKSKYISQKSTFHFFFLFPQRPQPRPVRCCKVNDRWSSTWWLSSSSKPPSSPQLPRCKFINNDGHISARESHHGADDHHHGLHEGVHQLGGVHVHHVLHLGF